jgi:hypothetical protein
MEYDIIMLIIKSVEGIVNLKMCYAAAKNKIESFIDTFYKMHYK